MDMSSPKAPSNTSKGSNLGVTWMMQNSKGVASGPHSTEAIMQMISGGEIQGTEKIKRLPDGRWIEISKQDEFYDRLLEALEEVVRSKESKLPRQPVEMSWEKKPVQNVKNTESTESLPPKNVNENDDLTEFPQISSLSTTDKFTSPPQTSLPPELSKTDVMSDNWDSRGPISRGPVLDLIRTPIKSNQNKRKIVFATSAIFAALCLVAIALLLPSGNSRRGKPHLVVPRTTSTDGLSAEKEKTLLKQAIVEFLKDTFEGYQESQNKLAILIEGAPQNTEARGLLCLVYKELWPFVSQDSQDLESVSQLTRVTRQLDPVGINGIYCDVTRLLIVGRYQEAKGVLEHSLNQTSLSAAPILYSLKAELLAGDRDFQTAYLYSEKASKLWPEWVKPVFDVGVYAAKAGNNQVAIRNLQSVQASNPKNKKAAIELGVLQYKFLQNAETALSTLTIAVSMSEKVPRLIEAKANFTIAQIYLEKRQEQKALSFSQKAHDLNPGDSQYRELLLSLGGSDKGSKNSSYTSELVFLGDQYVRTGDCLAAQAEFKAAFELDPENGLAAMKAAKCLWQLNQTNEAISYLNKAIAADKKLTSAYTLQADYYAQKYNYASAVQILSKASQQFTNNPEVLRGYGLLEFKRNNLKEAIAYLQRAQKIYENDTETLVLLAKVQAGLSLYKDASVSASRAVEIDSSNIEAQIVFAKIISQLYGVDQGINRLRELIVKYSYTIDFRLGLADLYKESERYKISQEIYQQIVDVDPRNKKAWIGLGESFQAQGLFDKALKSFLSSAITDPTDPEPLFKSGLIYLENDKYKDAINQFQRALKINPLYPRLNYYIGRAYFLNGDYNFALSSAQEERKANPNLAESYLLAAEVYTETKQFQKCAEEYQQAIKLRPQGAILYVKLARCYRQSGGLDIAESMLNIASNQESGNPEIYKEQGAIYETRGDIRSAVSAYNKYLALSPNAPDRRELEGRILRLSGN